MNPCLIDPAALDSLRQERVDWRFRSAAPALTGLTLAEAADRRLNLFTDGFFAPFVVLEQILARAEIVLTPHALAPYPRDDLRPSEAGMVNTGVFNLGFLGLREGPDADALLDWWEPHVLEDSRIDYLRGTFFDQKWMDLAPAYFGLCLLAASTANARTTFYAGLVCLSAVALWRVRGRRVVLSVLPAA